MDESNSSLVAPLEQRAPERQEGHARAVRAMFDTISPTYDRLNHTLSLGIDRRWRRIALSELQRDLPEGPVLDACAGTLDLTVELGKRSPDRSVIAMDFAVDMLKAGRAKLSRREDVDPADRNFDQIKRALGLCAADAQRLPFRDGTFAGVVCGFGIRNLASPAAGVAEVHRILKPGGVFVVLEFFQPEHWYTKGFHSVYGRFVLPMVGGLLSGNREAYSYLSKSMEGFMAVSAFERLLSDSGFEHVTHERLTLGIASVVRSVKLGKGGNDA